MRQITCNSICDVSLNTACYRIHDYCYDHRVVSADIVNSPTDVNYRPNTNAVY